MVSEIRVVLDRDELLPIRAYDTDAGADLKAKDSCWIEMGARTLVPTGVKVEIPEGYVGLLLPRSSLSKKDIIMSNSVGVIDSSYRGELLVALTYIGTGLGKTIVRDERIAQLLIVPIALPKFIQVHNLEDTARGVGGFGSTGE